MPAVPGTSHTLPDTASPHANADSPSGQPAASHETNIYDIRITQHEDGWIYGLFCTEQRDPEAAPGWIADEDGKVFIYYASSDSRKRKVPDEPA